MHVSKSQYGKLPPQSAWSRHSTHIFFPTKQRGVAPPQWLFVVQPTQTLLEHTGVAPSQSLSPAQEGGDGDGGGGGGEGGGGDGGGGGAGGDGGSSSVDVQM